MWVCIWLSWKVIFRIWCSSWDRPSNAALSCRANWLIILSWLLIFSSCRDICNERRRKLGQKKGPLVRCHCSAFCFSMETWETDGQTDVGQTRGKQWEQYVHIGHKDSRFSQILQLLSKPLITWLSENKHINDKLRFTSTNYLDNFLNPRWRNTRPFTSITS